MIRLVIPLTLCNLSHTGIFPRRIYGIWYTFLLNLSILYGIVIIKPRLYTDT